jgi:[acyl-carrier-protein] S-malonyltransferase
MMRDLAEAIPACREVFDVADRVLGRSISRLCFEGPQQELDLTHNTQPCMLAADLAAYAALTSVGFMPQAAAGFSLGEYAALVAAGVLPTEEAFRLVQVRADAMQEAVPIGRGGMAMIGECDEPTVLDLCSQVEGYVTPANYNRPGQIVVSGELRAIKALVALGKERGIRILRIPVSAPFHCELMRPAADRMVEPLSEVKLRDPSYPVYMNCDARPVHSAGPVAQRLLQQVTEPVRWESILRGMRADGIDTFVELGPGTTLSAFTAKTLGEVRILNVGDLETLGQTTAALQAAR